MKSALTQYVITNLMNYFNKFTPEQQKLLIELIAKLKEENTIESKLGGGIASESKWGDISESREIVSDSKWGDISESKERASDSKEKIEAIQNLFFMLSDEDRKTANVDRKAGIDDRLDQLLMINLIRMKAGSNSTDSKVADSIITMLKEGNTLAKPLDPVVAGINMSKPSLPNLNGVSHSVSAFDFNQISKHLRFTPSPSAESKEPLEEGKEPPVASRGITRK